MGIDAWAAPRGERPKGSGLVAQWFTDHEPLRTEARQARLQGWSWQQILNYLADEHGFPFTDPESVAKECR